MRIESIKVLAQLFYSRAVGRLGLGPDPMGLGFGNFNPQEELIEPASSPVVVEDEPTQLAPASFPKPSMRFDDLNNQTASCQKILKKFIKDNINEKNINSKNVRYVHDLLVSINSALELIVSSLEPGWEEPNITLRGCLEHLHEANIQMSGRKAVEFMKFSGYDIFHLAFMGVIDVLDKVVYEQLSYPESVAEPKESVA